MRALLIQLPHSGRVPTMFPLGISHIATALEEVGYEVEALDVFALELSKSDVTKYLSKSRWDLIGINAFSTQYAWAKWIAAEIKHLQPQALIVMGGSLPTFNSELVLNKTAVDVCVISEGEETIKDLVKNLGKFNNVQGISFRTEENKIVNTAPRPYIRDLDSLPFTKYDIFNMDIYFKKLHLFGDLNFKSINMLTTRGCPYFCNFCSRVFSGARFRSIDNIIEEIGALRDNYGIRGITFSDDLVLANKKRSYELCEKIRKLKIYWECQGRANLVDLDLLKAMKSAGCMSVGFGVESGSQKILDNMNKRVTVKQNEEAIFNTLKAGMIPVVQMIYGYPGEDLDTIHETVEFFNRVNFYPPTATGNCNFNLLTPLPGSKLYQESLRDGLILDEEKYLLELEQGYYIGSPLRLNFTHFSEEELLMHKSSMSEEIKKNYDNYIKKHPLVLFNRHFQVIKTILNIDGPIGLLKIIFSKFARIIFK